MGKFRRNVLYVKDLIINNIINNTIKNSRWGGSWRLNRIYSVFQNDKLIAIIVAA